MKKALIGLVVITSIVAGYFLLQPKETFDNDTVSYINQFVLPEVIEADVSFFFSSDWCEAISYGTSSRFSSVSSEGDAACAQLVGAATSSVFLVEDRRIFNRLKSALYSRNLSIDKVDLIEGVSGNALHFFLLCDDCGTTYAYSKDYDGLPESIKGEVKYQAINADWYKVQEEVN